MKVREEREAPKKKALAFKAAPSSYDEEDSQEDYDEDFAMLIRKVGKMFYKKGRQSKEGDLKKDLKRRERNRVHVFIARRRDT